MFGPFKFKGIVRKRVVCFYNTSFKFLKNKNYRFELLNLSKDSCSVLIKKDGKKVTFYESDRSIKLHIPQSKLKICNKKIDIKIYTNCKDLAKIIKHVKGLVKLEKTNFWFKSISSKTFKNSTKIVINSRGLCDYFKEKNITSIYIDKRKNYAIIKPTTIDYSRNSFISKASNDIYKLTGKLTFFIQESCKINYICLNDKNFKLTKRFFPTKEEFELAKYLIKKYPVLCISQGQIHDIKLLKINPDCVTELTSINLKNIKNIGNTRIHILSDILKGIIIFNTNKKVNFLVINNWWKNYGYLNNFGGVNVFDFSKNQGVKIMTTDYKKDWEKSIATKIENYLFLVKNNIAEAKSP